MESVDWILPLAVLAAGAIAGLVIAWRGGRNVGRATRREPSSDSIDQRDRAAKLEVLISQLRELEDLSSTRTPEQLATERADLEREAARLLRGIEIDRHARRDRAGMEPASPSSTLPAPPSSAMKGFLWGAGSVAAIVLLIVFVWQTASDRKPGETPTGGLPERPASPSSGGGPMVNLGELRTAVELNPADLEARLDLAQALLIIQDLEGVFEQTQAVLRVNPDQPRALSYESLVRVVMGETDRALEMARRSVQLDPNNPESFLHLAVVHVQRGEREEGARVIEEAMRRFPGEASTLATILAQIREAQESQRPNEE
ncbi:MAG TPA: tetratricopeptide repeat protein [Thermoanaerobaculia bacterium]|nr:tetratricopeptide repeat protein [Thermoanaerobaculia bacterium]